LDPGSGSMLLYFLVGVISALVYSIKNLFFEVKLSISQLLANDKIAIKDKKDIVLDEKEQVYWIRFKVKNTLSIAKDFYLISERNYVYYMEYYLIKKGKIVLHSEDGFSIRPQNQPFNTSYRTFHLPLDSGEEAEVFLKVQNFNMIDIPFKLVTKDYIIDDYQDYNLLQGMFFGIMMIMILYNLVLYFIVKLKAYLFYISYLFFLTFYMLSYYGYLHRYTNIDPIFITLGIAIGAIGFVTSVTFFMRSLFFFKKYIPALDKAFQIFVIFLLTVVILFCISLFMDSFYYSQLFFNLLTSLLPLYATLLIYALYLLAYKRVSRLALGYAIAWSFVGGLGIALMATHAGFISTEVGVDYIFQGGMAFEALLFSVMLAYRINEIEEEKKEDQAKLVHQSRLASMGEMISSIAHQWRQPLSEINGRVLSLDIQVHQEKLFMPEVEEHLNGIEEVTEYLSGTINDFMNFFSIDKELESFMVSELIERTERIARLSSSQEMILSTVMQEDVLLVGYKSELVQSLLIVIHNSIDACVSKNIKEPRIRLEVVNDKSDIHIFLEDNGGGISKEIIELVFDPYFTTKYQSQGTGLGLYILKMIIERSMKGSVSIENYQDGVKCCIKIPKKIEVK
ncbi:MAG: sensor histidine kinase, partial [Epsilonproteobacteria bacterium]|nr:sensor histidine kinase [Campylobacterota bacterium]